MAAIVLQRTGQKVETDTSENANVRVLTVHTDALGRVSKIASLRTLSWYLILHNA
jgi:hypothetical protein